jgi:hypothetical protein
MGARDAFEPQAVKNPLAAVLAAIRLLRQRIQECTGWAEDPPDEPHRIASSVLPLGVGVTLPTIRATGSRLNTENNAVCL